MYCGNMYSRHLFFFVWWIPCLPIDFDSRIGAWSYAFYQHKETSGLHSNCLIVCPSGNVHTTVNSVNKSFVYFTLNVAVSGL